MRSRAWAMFLTAGAMALAVTGCVVPTPGGGGPASTTSTTEALPACRVSTDALEFRMDGGFPGTAYGDPELSNDTPVFAGGQSIELDGNDSFQVNAPTYDTAVSVEAWIKPTALGGLQIMWDDYGNPGVLLKTGDDEIGFNISTTEHPGLGIQRFGGTVVEGVWQHVAGVYDGSELRVYLDGVEVASAATSGPIQTSGDEYAGIGGGDGFVPGNQFSGLMDDLRIYQRAISPSELGYIDAQPCTTP